MQIKSSNKFIDLYLFTIGFVIIFFLFACNMPKFRWLALIPVFGAVLWMIVLKHRFPKAVRVEGNTLTVKYFHAFRTKYESFPLRDCGFNLEMYTRTIGKGTSTQNHYNLSIFVNNTEKWKLSTLEGFYLEDFQTLLKYIGIY
jgi:hypothetical protein